MPLSPKIMKQKIEDVTTAWKNLAPGKSFAGMTHEEFKTKVKTSLDAREEVDDLEDRLVAAHNRRDDADKATGQTLQQVVNSVRGDLEFGEDSALYEAMGYVRKSERKSGLKRTNNNRNGNNG